MNTHNGVKRRLFSDDTTPPRTHKRQKHEHGEMHTPVQASQMIPRFRHRDGTTDSASVGAPVFSNNDTLPSVLHQQNAPVPVDAANVRTPSRLSNNDALETPSDGTLNANSPLIVSSNQVAQTTDRTLANTYPTSTPFLVSRIKQTAQHLNLPFTPEGINCAATIVKMHLEAERAQQEQQWNSAVQVAQFEQGHDLNVIEGLKVVSSELQHQDNLNQRDEQHKDNLNQRDQQHKSNLNQSDQQHKNNLNQRDEQHKDNLNQRDEQHKDEMERKDQEAERKEREKQLELVDEAVFRCVNKTLRIGIVSLILILILLGSIPA